MISKNTLPKETLDQIEKLSEEIDKFSKSIYTSIVPILNEYNKVIENCLGPLYNNLIDPLNEFTKKIEPIIKEIEEDQKLSKKQLISKYKTRIEDNTLLGKNGWVVSPHTNLSILQEWINDIKNNNGTSINDFFDSESGIIQAILESLKKEYNNYDIKPHFEKAYSFFINEDYFTCAFYLLALLDNRINKVLDFGNKTKCSKKFTLEGIDSQINKEFTTDNSSISRKYFLVLDIYPSLCSFLYRLYVDGDYKFEKGIEPPYLNRNWVMHGRSNRVITRTDCIQLINALDSVEFINQFTANV